MAKDLKKPTFIRELDIKEYAGDIVITEEVSPVQAEKEAAIEKIEVAVAQASANPEMKMLSFNAWFQKANTKNPRVKMSYREAIEAHCKAVGLTGSSTEEAFDAALVHFGL